MFGPRNRPWCARTARNSRLRAVLASTKRLRQLLSRRSLLRSLPGARGRGTGRFGAQLLLDLELLEPGREDVLLRAAPVLVVGIARAGRDQPAHDDVLLEAAQIVTQAADGGFREHSRRLLEGGCRDERLRGQRGLRDAEQHGVERRPRAVLDPGLAVRLDHAMAVDLLAAQQARVAGARDLDLAQHLSNDDLDVLVVDLHALQAIDVLDLADEVVGQLLDALQPQDVVRVRLAVGDDLAAQHLFALEDVQVAPLRDELLVLLTLVVGNDETALALGLLAEADRARVLGEDRRVLRTARLE